MTDTFKTGHGYTSALDDPDPRVRHAARSLGLGRTAGKVRRQGITRARPTRPMGARDGDVDQYLEVLARDKGARRKVAGWINKSYGVTAEDVRRVTNIRGRPSRELAPLRDKVAIAFSDIVDREAFHTQRGRRIARRTLLVVYGLEEWQVKRLLEQGREARESAPSVAIGGTTAAEDEAAYLAPGDIDPDQGEDTADEDDTPAYDDRAGWDKVPPGLQ